jgi:hypothetical protein
VSVSVIFVHSVETEKKGIIHHLYLYVAAVFAVTHFKTLLDPNYNFDFFRKPYP